MCGYENTHIRAHIPIDDHCQIQRVVPHCIFQHTLHQKLEKNSSGTIK